MQPDKGITFGEREKDGFSNVYSDGEKTNVRLFLWDENEVKRLQAIGEEIYKKMELEKSTSELVKSSKSIPKYKHHHTRLGYIIWAILLGLATITCIWDALYTNAWYWIVVPIMLFLCIVETVMAIKYQWQK